MGYQVHDADGKIKYEVSQSTHDDLNCNANVQQGDADVAADNALYVQPGTGASFAVESTDLDIRELTSASDSVLVYGSDDGGTTKRVIKTDAGGAIQVDLEVASVEVTAFPDNEPFDLAQYGGVAVGVGNAVHVQPGTGAVFQVQSNSADLATETTVASIDGKITACDTGSISGSVEQDGTALGNGQITADTTVGGVQIVAASAGRHGVDITNQGSVDCYVGTGSVTTSNGFLLGAGESIFMPTDSEVKGITAADSTTIGYLSYA